MTIKQTGNKTVFTQRGWSLESISKRLCVEMEAQDQLPHHFYSHIQENKIQGGTLHRHLPMFGKRRWKGGERNKDASAKFILNIVELHLGLL